MTVVENKKIPYYPKYEKAKHKRRKKYLVIKFEIKG